MLMFIANLPASYYGLLELGSFVRQCMLTSVSSYAFLFSCMLWSTRTWYFCATVYVIISSHTFLLHAMVYWNFVFL